MNDYPTPYNAAELLEHCKALEAKLTQVARAFYVDGKTSALRTAFAGWKDVAKPAREVIKKYS